MRAVVMHEFGPPDVLRNEVVETPRPGPGEALVRIGAVTVNRSFDLRVREDGNNRDPVLPLVLGADPAGQVVAVGPDVSEVRVGDHVAVWRAAACRACAACRRGDPDDCQRKRMVGIHRWGGYAQYAALPVETLQVIPKELGYAEAAVVLRHFPTALALAHARAGLQAGETVLVMGAAGGLGSALVQVARAAGARVIVGAGSDERVAAALALGGETGINYRAQDLAAECRRLTGGHGVDVVFENIADPTLWPGAYDSLAYAGRLATVGAHGGGQVTLDVRRLYGQHLSVLGGASPRRAEVQRALQGARTGEFRALIGATLPLEQAAEAHRLVANSKVVGKVVLTP
jgi:NADPH:quinone reductase-like Zn-dependent oxidoreductase